MIHFSPCRFVLYLWFDWHFWLFSFHYILCFILMPSFVRIDLIQTISFNLWNDLKLLNRNAWRRWRGFFLCLSVTKFHFNRTSNCRGQDQASVKCNRRRTTKAKEDYCFLSFVCFVALNSFRNFRIIRICHVIRRHIKVPKRIFYHNVLCWFTFFVIWPNDTHKHTYT